MTSDHRTTTIAMTLTNGSFLDAARTGGAWTEVEAVAYAVRMTTCVSTSVRD